MFAALEKLVLESGAAGAAWLSCDQIVLDPIFRDICAGNACGKFGGCYMCPPDIGDINHLIAEVKQYHRALLYQTIGQIEDSFDFEGMMEVGHTHAMVSQRIRQGLPALWQGDVLHLTGGGCHLCQRCGKPDGIPCRHPEEALSSLEGYGIDVYKTSTATPLSYVNGENTVTYFGMILLKEER